MEERMERAEKQLPVESAAEEPDIEARIKEGKPVIITIPVDDDCKSPDVYVVSDNTSTIKQETKPVMNPVPQRNTFSQGSVSSKPTVIVNIDDDDEDECYEKEQMTPKREKNAADWSIQDVLTPGEMKNSPDQSGDNGHVNVWFVKSVKVNNQNPPKAENPGKSVYVVDRKTGANPVKDEYHTNERKPDVKALANSSVPPQVSQNASGFLENQALHNRPASIGSNFGAHLPDAITIEDDLIDEMEEKIQVCPECSQCFTSLSDLEMHMGSHKDESSWICSDCGKSYYTKSSLDRHQLTHAREKPLKCPDCGKGFTKQIHLEMHLRLHAGEVLFPCTECEKVFSSKSSCDRHIRAHKMERPHVCPQCGKGFLYNGCLIRHIRVHTGERPFPCPECGRCFRQTSALNRHVKTHTGEKPFDCSECGKCFTHQSDLNRHKETHRGSQQYVQCIPSNESLPTYIIL
ncbi:uncharacterized protein LOC142659899 isoform X2 [Rhinoderma darwinii]